MTEPQDSKAVGRLFVLDLSGHAVGTCHDGCTELGIPHLKRTFRI